MSKYFIGQMSGTSLDGVDSVLMEINDAGIQLLSSHHLDFSTETKQRILDLCTQGENELHLSQLMSNEISDIYSTSINQMLEHSQIKREQIVAIGAHGQTIRHMPPNYTVQIINGARLAEQSNITVVTDFRSRDLAAGGQGAPLVPAFHQHLFGLAEESIVVVNIGGMANISVLNSDGSVSGYDTGPGNVLMDAWFSRHLNGNYDEDGNWAKCGDVIPELLEAFMEEPYFSQPAPKSTGRELFDLAWLLEYEPENYAAEDVQATLLQLTSQSIAQEILKQNHVEQVIICGGGAYNSHLVQSISDALPLVKVKTSDEFGIDAQAIEALAFGWLAQRCIEGLTGNVPEVTGANGQKVLGAIYPR